MISSNSISSITTYNHPQYQDQGNSESKKDNNISKEVNITLQTSIHIKLIAKDFS